MPVTPTNIKGVRLQFRPGKGLTGLLQVDALKFKKVPGLAAKATDDGSGGGLGA